MIPVDLYLRVTLDQTVQGTRVLSYELSSPAQGGVVLGTAISESLGSFESHGSLRQELESLMTGRYTASGMWTGARILEKLQNVGRNLYWRLMPPELRRIFNDPSRPHGTSLVIHTDEMEIPWELLCGPAGDFWAVRFRLARWTRGVDEPDSVQHVGRMLGIDGGRIDDPEVWGQAPVELPQTGQELDGLESLTDRRPRLGLLRLDEGRKPDVERALAQGGFGWVHFAGHAEFASQQADRAFLHLNGGALEALDLVEPLSTALARDRPVVFLNACRSGAGGQAFSGLGGWAQRFVQVCRCNGFIGPHWAIQSKTAARFAARFYRHLDGGLPLGEAVRQARLEGGVVDPRSLAYSFWGHPNAVVRWAENRPAHFRNADGAFASGTVSRPTRLRDLPNLGPSPEEKLAEEVERFSRLGLQHLESGSFSDAAKAFREARQRDPSWEHAFHLALALLGDAPPETLHLSKIRRIEALLEAAGRAGKSRLPLLYWALIKKSFYQRRGLPVHPPTIEELVSSARGGRIELSPCYPQRLAIIKLLS